MIYPNGKIAFYYEEVSKAIKGNQVKSSLIGRITCGINEGNQHCPKHNSINPCQEATTSDIKCIWCKKYDICTASSDEDNHELKVNGCQVENSSIVETTPTNHEGTMTGITEPDLRNELTETTQTNESHLCFVLQNSSIVNVSNEATPTNHEEIMTGITEPDLGNELIRTAQTAASHLNMTAGMTENREQRKSNNPLYIVIPLFVLFLVVCIGCVVCLWFYRRKKSNT